MLLFLLNLNQPQVERSIIDIFLSAFFAFTLGKDDGGSNTMMPLFELAINSSRSFSRELLSENPVERYSSNLLEEGNFRFLSLSYEPRTI